MNLKLAKYLQVLVSEMTRQLPKFIDWSKTIGFRDCSYSEMGFFMVEFTSVHGKSWTLTPVGAPYGEGCRLNGTRQVPVTWLIRVDIETGEVWADPQFSGYDVDDKTYTLQEVCKAMRLAKPRLIGCVDQLVQLGVPGSGDSELTQLGIDTSLPEVFVRAKDAERIRSALKTALKIS